MSSPNDYILITESRNLDDGSSDSDVAIHEEDEDASLRALESQGISILGDTDDRHERRGSADSSTSTEPRDQLSRELMDEGGIEIISSNEEESFL